MLHIPTTSSIILVSTSFQLFTAIFQVQLELTGIFMHGKIPSLKVSLIQLFRGHMWQKIHEQIVYDLTQLFDNNLSELKIQSATKEVIHPRKSYKMNTSCADIILTSSGTWSTTMPCFVSDTNAKVTPDIKTRTLFIDVQLRWGDYDSHDIERYTRSLFLSYTTDTQSLYPCNTGIIIGIDLCYNEWSAFGTWIPGLQEVVTKAMKNIMIFNPSLNVLRERCKNTIKIVKI